MKVLFGISVAIVLIVGGVLMLTADTEPIMTDLELENQEIVETENEVYRNESYDFSFEVPVGLSVNEYTSEIVAIGQPTDGGFAAEAEVLVAQSGAEGGYENFNSFLFEVTRNMCAADGPTGTMYCENMVGENSFSTKNGLTGTEFYLSRIYENFVTGKRTEEEFGPFIAFTIQANTPESDFSALIIRPSVATESVNEELVRNVADTIQINASE